MGPGQIRPTFAIHDREKRYAVTAAAWVLGAGGILNVMHPSASIPFFVGLVGLIVVTQVVYLKRMGFVRRVASQLAQEFPGDRFLVGNVRFVRTGDGGPNAVDFTTTVLQFSSTALSLWNPDSPSHPRVAIAYDDLDVDVTKGTPPRSALVAPYSAGETHIAVFGETGLGFESEARLQRLARELFRLDGITKLRTMTEGGTETP